MDSGSAVLVSVLFGLSSVSNMIPKPIISRFSFSFNRPDVVDSAEYRSRSRDAPTQQISFATLSPSESAATKRPPPIVAS